ncbi:MAG: cob(I)yrinic acid a,c-diamide adenosyltransferase [Bacteroidales bacterium]
MKIYTKTGDRGETSLIGGTRIPKDNERIESYGTIDELTAYIGLLRDVAITKKQEEELIEIQDRLMTCASIVATDCENCEVKLPELSSGDITYLERAIDAMEKDLPPLRAFVLPGGHSTVSFCHIARNVCRRAERVTLKVQKEFSNSQQVIQYLNRLSDYLFVLSRALTKQLKAKEVEWKPRV